MGRGLGLEIYNNNNYYNNNNNNNNNMSRKVAERRAEEQRTNWLQIGQYFVTASRGKPT